jgi:FAD/FMN-containing dehydrogenase
VVGELRNQVNSQALKFRFSATDLGFKHAHNSHSGALQDWLWESGTNANETCEVIGRNVKGAQCHQGRIPFYSVSVESAAHIQSSVDFTRKHNLRLVIRNTGHDGAGRSSGPDSLQIHTHRMKEITYHHDFTPIGSIASGEGPAVTVGAGVMLGDLYAQGSHDGYTVVGGECPTVGAAGGFILGGGVSSILSHTRGLAVDNVLEFEIVTASVSVS